MSETAFDPRMNQEPDSTLDVDAARRNEAIIAQAQRDASAGQPEKDIPRDPSDLQVQLASVVARAIAAGDIEGATVPRHRTDPDSLNNYPGSSINASDRWMSGEA